MSDTTRALDGMALYLNFFAGLWAAAACVAAQRAERAVAPFASTIRPHRVAGRRACIAVLGWAVCIHLLQCAITAGLALSRGAVAFFDPLVALQQVAVIVIAVGVGGICGAYLRNPLVAVLLCLAFIGSTTLFTGQPLSILLTVGGGYNEAFLVRTTPHWQITRLALALGILMLVWPLRWRPRLTASLRLAGHAVVAGSLVAVFLGGPQVEPRPVALSCSTGELTICEPSVVGTRGQAAVAEFRTLYASLPDYWRDYLPARWVVNSFGGAPSASTGLLAFTYDGTQTRRETQMASIYALTTPFGCITTANQDSGPNGDVFVLQGWLQVEQGIADSTTYPQDEVNRLLALPRERQDAAVRAMLDSVFSCSKQPINLDDY